MKKQVLIGSVAVIVILLLIIVLLLFSSSPAKDIDVTILEMNYENERFYVNVSIKNNQDKIGWMDDTYLTTIEGNAISLTGSGIDKKIESGDTIMLTLFSAEIYDSIIDPPFKLVYTTFPSGNTYAVHI